MLSQDQIQNLSGTTAYDQSEDKLGKVGQVYLDDQTNEPTWITVNTGLFGTSESFVPVQGARLEGDRLFVAYDKQQIKDAPNIDEDGHLTPEDEQQLYRHYGLGYGAADRSDHARTESGVTSRDTVTEGTGVSGRHAVDEGYAEDAGRERATGTVGRDTSGPTTDEAMTVSEERLRVGTEQVETGRARLRKYVVTENVTQTVPVSREEVRVEREPITDANRDEAYDGPAISEEEHEVVLHAERPVVDKDVEAVERVRLNTETVTGEEQVSDELRKERVETDGVDRVDEGQRAGEEYRR